MEGRVDAKLDVELVPQNQRHRFRDGGKGVGVLRGQGVDGPVVDGPATLVLAAAVGEAGARSSRGRSASSAVALPRLGRLRRGKSVRRAERAGSRLSGSGRRRHAWVSVDGACIRGQRLPQNPCIPVGGPVPVGLVGRDPPLPWRHSGWWRRKW